MKKAFFLVLAILFLLQIGCTKSIRYTEEEIKNFSPEIQDNIRKGEIALGMTPQQVRYTWGDPDSIKFLAPMDGKTREEWIYSITGTMQIIGEKLLLFVDGKLIYIK